MKLFNTLSRELEDIKPIHKDWVGIYTCGPTVYDHAHIGHWFTYIRMDLLIRTLKSSGLNTKWVMNITDVGHLTSDADEGEDKLEKGAKREGKTAWQIAQFYEDEFIKEMNLLNILKPDYITRATEHISEQIELIRVLESKGYTYQIDDGIYFDTSKFKDYSKFAKLDLDEQQAGARVDFNQQKRNSSDFALWKFTPENTKRDMQWESPWGVGFPGWHIECSAMSMKYLGETIDIHCGGIDHIPIHHTNEIAQSEASTGKKLANYWMHSNHVMIDNQKISKSLGNGITLNEILKKGFSTEDIRLLVLESSYLNQSKFSFDTLLSAKNRLNDIKAFAVMRYQTNQKALEKQKEIEETKKEIKNSLENNLDSVNALVSINELAKKILSQGLNPKDLEAFLDLIKYIDEALGLKLFEIKDINDEIRSLISEREQARLDEDWNKSDEIRGLIEEKGIKLKDELDTTRWYLQ